MCLQASAKRTDSNLSNACAKSHPSICSLLHSIVSIILLADSEGPGQDAQADLGLRRPHMPEDKFSNGTAHLMFNRFCLPFSVCDGESLRYSLF